MDTNEWKPAAVHVRAAKERLQEAAVEMDRAAGQLPGEMHSAAVLVREELTRLIRQTHNLALIAGIPPAEMERLKR